MLKVGLTGGIASGKSLVAGVFQTCGAAVIDADRIARQVVVPGQPGWRRIVEHFGKGVLNSDRTLNRAHMAGIVFGDDVKRNLLDSLLHPLIMDELTRRIREFDAAGSHKVVIADVPLLFECGCQELFDRIVVMWTEQRMQRRRLMQRDGMTAREAGQRLTAQMSLDDKVRHADYVIKNTGSVSECASEAARLYGVLQQESERKIMP